jgi:hypothetical protein
MLEKQPADYGTEWEGHPIAPSGWALVTRARRRLEMAQLVGLVGLFIALFVAAGMFAL